MFLVLELYSGQNSLRYQEKFQKNPSLYLYFLNTAVSVKVPVQQQWHV
jgi:hypothetical protein